MKELVERIKRYGLYTMFEHDWYEVSCDPEKYDAPIFVGMVDIWLAERV